MSAEVIAADIRIRELARAFPCLRGAPGVPGLWSAVDLDEWAASVASSGEKHSARFVLSVWNSYEDWPCGRFNLFEAMGVWDYQHREAFMNWMEEPGFA